MLKIATGLCLLCLSGTVAASQLYNLTLTQWSGPKTGASVLQMGGVAAAVRDMDSHPDGRLLLRYPGGDEGSLWVEQLRAWLLALGVGPKRIQTSPGSSSPDVIEMEVLGGNDSE